MSNSQNKKNEQQNNLCTTLTEQLKKGKLKDGHYFFKTKDNIKIGFLYEGFKYPYDGRYNTIDNVEEVLAPVPSYEETKLVALKIDCICEKIAELAVENRQLKELLKGHKEKLKYCTRETYELQTKIAEVLK